MAFTSRTAGLARAAVTAVGGLIDGVVRALTAAWATAWDALAGVFLAAAEALIARSPDRWPSRSAVDNDPGVRRALAQARRALDQLDAQAATEATSAARAAVEQAAENQAAVIASQLPADYDTARILGRTRTGFHGEAMRAIERRSAQRITALTRPLSVEADHAMRRELIRGVRLGRSPRDTARAMVQQVQGAFNGGLTRALVIARTETLDAYREAARVTQDASEDVLAGWVWLAELTRRTCPACWAMHGTVHPLSEPGPQGHPQCRCSRAPKTRTWAELGFDLPEPDDEIRDAQATFQALPRDQQLAIMGPTRLAMLEDGVITWADLARKRDNPGWRPSWTATPVRDLVPN